jgi:thiol:disulfide interchange protein
MQKNNSTSPTWKKIKNILGFIFIVVGIAFATQSYKETFYAKEQIQEDFWHTNYFKALEIAKKEKKNVFVDFWAEHCAVCMSRNKTVLKDKDVVKVLKEKYKLFGLPAFLLIDPTTEKVEKKWTTITKEDIISDVK